MSKQGGREEEGGEKEEQEEGGKRRRKEGIREGKDEKLVNTIVYTEITARSLVYFAYQ